MMAKLKKETPPDLDGEFKNTPWASACFKIDSFEVHLTNEFYKNKLLKMIWVNGAQSGRWMVNKDSEESQRFAYSSFRNLYSKKEREDFKKIFKGARFKEHRKTYDKKLESRMFHTGRSIKAIIKQWCEREINKSIVLVDSEGNELFKYK